MNKITPVPGPSQADFDALNGKIRRGRETLASTQPNTVTTISVTLSPAMPNINYSVCATANGSTVGLCCVGDISTTGFKIYVRNVGTGAISGSVEWIVIA